MHKTSRNKEKNYIFYGTLRDPEIQALIAGKSLAEKFWQTAIIPGYSLHFVKSCLYPALKSNPQSQFTADLYLGLSLEEQRAIFDYEGDEYELVTWQVHGQDFQIFLPLSSVRLSDEIWDLHQFQNSLKSTYLAWLADA
ncbi:MAG: gamma-glutamylcyclotransferase family protein [Oligoflexus sp.]